MVRTYYERLGVPADATTDEIEAAYRERLKETHPDVSDAEDAEERTKRLVEARDVLVDDDERARYDRMGHAAYVGREESDSGADATAATNRAGYGDSETAGESRTTDRADQDPWERARQRAARERRAREKVGATEGSESEPTGSRRSSSDWDTRDTGRGWRESSGYTVRREVRTARNYEQLLPSGRRLTLLVITFALYPVLLLCALLPAFPLLVNATVALCAILVVAYLQTYPEVAVLVFGGWTAIATVGLMALAVDPLTLVALSVLGGTWLPFGFSLLTFWALRW